LLLLLDSGHEINENIFLKIEMNQYSQAAKWIKTWALYGILIYYRAGLRIGSFSLGKL